MAQGSPTRLPSQPPENPNPRGFRKPDTGYQTPVREPPSWVREANRPTPTPHISPSWCGLLVCGSN